MADIQPFANTKFITAFAAGGQTGAIQITKPFTIIRTAAAPLASVKLLTGIPNDPPFQVANKSANAVNIYPKEGENLFGLGINIPLKLNPGNTVTFRCWDGERKIYRFQ